MPFPAPLQWPPGMPAAGLPRASNPATSSAPQSLKSGSRGTRVELRVPDLFVAEVILDQPRVVPSVCQKKSTGMPEHVRMDRHRQSCSPADFAAQITECLPGHRPPLAQEQIWAVRPPAYPQPRANGAEFVSLDRLARAERAFFPSDEYPSGVQVEVCHPHINQFADAHPMAVGHQHEQVIAGSVAALPCRVQEGIHLGFGQEVLLPGIYGRRRVVHSTFEYAARRKPSA